MSAHPLVVLLAVATAVGLALLTTACRSRPRRPVTSAQTSVGIGTVASVPTGSDTVTVEVHSVSAGTFTGRLLVPDDPIAAGIRPGVVLLVVFDPAAREDLWLPDDMAAIRAAFDSMLVGKGLITESQLNLIRHGVRGTGVVTAARPTGAAREDHCEVVLDLMVRRPEGGQFPAHETTLIPSTALRRVSPGSVIDAYYFRDDESSVAVCIPPA